MHLYKVKVIAKISDIAAFELQLISRVCILHTFWFTSIRFDNVCVLNIQLSRKMYILVYG